MFFFNFLKLLTRYYLSAVFVFFKYTILIQLYLGYFFNSSPATLLLYGLLVIVSMSNSWGYFLFLFLIDLPITFGILSVLMKTPATRPSIYLLLGEENVTFFLGNPGKLAATVATRLGICLVTASVVGVGVGGIQDQLNNVAANQYAETMKELGQPMDPSRLHGFYDRKSPFSWDRHPPKPPKL